MIQILFLNLNHNQNLNHVIIFVILNIHQEKQHSWYIECLLYVQHWFKTQKYIRVPDWIKKYF